MTLKKMLVLVLLLVVSLSACQAQGLSTNLVVELNDFTITPAQLRAPAGATLQIEVTNQGIVAHNFYIMKLGVEVGEKFDAADQAQEYWHVEVQPGETLQLSLAAPDEPGTYQVVCGMPGHVQAGMVATLEVVK